MGKRNGQLTEATLRRMSVPSMGLLTVPCIAGSVGSRDPNSRVIAIVSGRDNGSNIRC
jgi:hypothetical protein